MAKTIANEFLAQLPTSELRDFCNKNMKGYHVFTVRRIGSARKVYYWEEAQRNKGTFEMTFYDNQIIPKNAVLEVAWKNFMYEKFGEAYKEKYMKEE